MKHAIIFVIILILASLACGTNSTPAVIPDTLNTVIVQTAAAAATQTAFLPLEPANTQSPSSGKSAEDYLNEYGGNLDVYINILSLTDCIALQGEFDIASGNNARETPGTPQFNWTLGYMTATDDHMQAIGCYQSRNTQAETASVIGCSCSADTLNCSDFSTPLEAQGCFDSCLAVGAGDIHKLDSDNDSIACESLP